MNWLESEEKKKALDDVQKAIKSKDEENRRLNRNLDHTQKQEILHKNLNPFYELCDRILKLNQQRISDPTLTISKFNVVGSFKIDKYPAETDYKDTDYNGFPNYISLKLTGRRGIRFSVNDSDKIIISIMVDIKKTEVPSPQGYYFMKDKYPKEHSTILFIKECSNHDIVEWKEENMIDIVRWIILDIDNFEDNLPGKNDGVFEKEKRDVLTKLYHELNKQENILSDIKRFHFNRSDYEKENQISDQNSVIGKLKVKILNIEKNNTPSWVATSA